jgi:probable H4MPT-linked C1 transfer pathway protein
MNESTLNPQKHSRMDDARATGERSVIGWDIGGAHVKACLTQRGEVIDVAQWPCPLWQGLEHLLRVLQTASQRWPEMSAAQHAVTMTGEMVDLFANREIGVRRIAAELAQALQLHSTIDSAQRSESVHFYCGDAGWCDAAEVAERWSDIASANWLATARHCALRFGEGLLVDIGSTTTDLIAFKDGRVLTRSRTDAQRLASSELVYHGVVRTPLCAVARRVEWRGEPHNVMNEFFATTADVYRTTGELDATHDQHPTADNTAKDLPSTMQRLARMIGLDARDGSAEDWLAFAQSWRAAQVQELGDELRRVSRANRLGPNAIVVSAGCGDFLVRDVLSAAASHGADDEQTPSIRLASYGADVAVISAQAHARKDAAVEAVTDAQAEPADAQAVRANVQAWAQICAPCVAVATLFDQDRR